MQYELLPLLRCPVSRKPLRFKLIREFERTYNGRSFTEIRDGLLLSDEGFVFPIIDGIPRMLIESFDDYNSFLRSHVDNYDDLRAALENKYAGLIEYCKKKNKRTKDSFELEWSFLNADANDRIWHYESPDLFDNTLRETGWDVGHFAGKRIVDIGCGHGKTTGRFGEISQYAVGVEISKAVENAYRKNHCKNAWFIQGDLQFLPFSSSQFDLLYCSGVLHHTNNTELSFLLIDYVVAPSGSICLWLYHPQENILHHLILALRSLVKRLPLRVAMVFLSVFIFPFTWFLKQFTRKNPPNYREEIIDLLDQFTPEFRHETTHDRAIVWLQKNSYTDIQITTEDQFGFSITGRKDAPHQ